MEIRINPLFNRNTEYEDPYSVARKKAEDYLRSRNILDIKPVYNFEVSDETSNKHSKQTARNQESV